MKFTINTKKFVECLACGGSMAGKNKVLAILSCVKLKVRGENLFISSFDGECAVLTKTDGAVDVIDGDVCVNASDLLRVLRSIKDDTVTLECENNAEVEIIYSRGSLSFPAYDAASFPQVVAGENSISFKMDAPTILDWVSIGSNYCADDPFRPAFSGMYLYRKTGEVGCCSTDAHRLFSDRKGIADDTFTDSIGVIVSNRAFAPLRGLLGKCDEVLVTVDDKNVTFALENAKLCCRRIEQQYPNFEAIIPTTSTTRVVVDVSDFRDALTRCALCADASTSMVKLTIGEGALTVDAEDVNLSKKASESIGVSIDGVGLTMIARSDYLITALSSIDARVATLHLLEPSKPLMVKDICNEGRRILVMPCVSCEGR